MTETQKTVIMLLGLIIGLTAIGTMPIWMVSLAQSEAAWVVPLFIGGLVAVVFGIAIMMVADAIQRDKLRQAQTGPGPAADPNPED